MKTFITLLFCVTCALGSNLPNAPSQRIFDWSFITGHTVYGLSVAGDDYLTQHNLYSCAFEGNPDLGRTPTAKAQAIHGLVEFGAVVTADALFKWFGRHQGVPKWVNMVGGNLGATIGTVKHSHAMAQWVNICY